jgi:ArsR family transcriptional regulator, lead/cadmium/zinc/bismuth-responsive transcriptional repressor
MHYTILCNAMPAHSFDFNQSAFDSQPELVERPLLSKAEAKTLMALFKVFANDTRLRLLHALVRKEEMHVSDLALVVEMKPQAVSNQLQRMATCGILGSRRKGNNVYYHVKDVCVPVLLERGLCLVACHPNHS